jgi:hypothetical protein
VFTAVAVTPVVDGEFRGSHGDAMARLGHAVANGEGTAAVSTLPAGGEPREEYRGWPGWRPAHRRRGFLPSYVYPMATAHESRRAAINGDGPPAVRAVALAT